MTTSAQELISLSSLPASLRSTSLATAVQNARAASEFWQHLSIEERGRRLLAFRDRLIDRLDEITAVIGEESDKPRFDAINEVFQCCDLIGYFVSNGPKILRPRKVWPHLLLHKKATLHYRPLGVVGIIAPWNYPIVLPLGPTVQALIAGNAVLLKPSERVPRLNRILAQLLAGLDDHHPVVQVIEGGPEIAIELAGSAVDKISFTGGTEAGRAIARTAAEKLTPVILELGGNDAMIVAEDADIDRAAGGAVWGSFFNAGQSCLAVERCYVHQSVAQAFLDRLITQTTALSQGLSDQNAPRRLPKAGWDHDLGPIFSPEQNQRVRELVQDALDKGARVACGGIPEDPESRFFPPTVLTNVNHSMRIMQEETFGPVLSVMVVDSINTALSLANESRYGLSASIWTRDSAKAREWASRLRVGGVVINDCMVHYAIPELPFGGTKQSGYGRTMGPEGLREFCMLQSVTQHRFGPRAEFQWFPTRGKYRIMQRLARLMFRSGWSRRFYDSSKAIAPPKDDHD